jgi:hypothetical protein
LIWLPKNKSNALKRYLTRGHENASITKRPMKFWAHVLHFTVECSQCKISNVVELLIAHC